MSKITMQRSKNTVTANTFLPGGAYKCAIKSARAYEGEIGKTAEGLFTVTFNEVETAEKFIKEWRASYATAHETYVPKSTPATNKAPKSTKKSKPSSTKKGKGKGKGFDFSTIKGNTKSEKNKALHATLVGMGHADSRSPEYQAVWSARPWAN